MDLRHLGLLDRGDLPDLLVGLDARRPHVLQDPGDRRPLDDLLHGLDVLRPGDLLHGVDLWHLELLDHGDFPDLLDGLDGRQLHILRDLGDRRHLDDLPDDLLYGLDVQYLDDLPHGLRHLEMLDRGSFRDLLDGLDRWPSTSHTPGPW